jgi:hypothetical protein
MNGTYLYLDQQIVRGTCWTVDEHPDFILVARGKVAGWVADQERFLN